MRSNTAAVEAADAGFGDQKGQLILDSRSLNPPPSQQRYVQR